ncbi:MAG: hypothetical protein SGBAC_011578 [Bacillariaceae sp.]
MSTSLGYGFAMDMRNGIPNVITSGIDYEADYQRVTLNDQANTECYVSLGYDSNVDRVTFDSPNICLDVATMNLPNQQAGSGLPDVIVTAMAGHQPLIVSLEYGTEEFSQSTLVDAALLPTRYFPAVMTTDKLGGVYVALHPTHGTFIAPAAPGQGDTNNQAEEMRSTWFFLEQMTRPAPIFVEPNITDLDHSPKIVKYNMLTKDTEWIHTLDTQNGKALVSGMAISQLRNKLVIVGSASGSGPGIGAGAVSDGDWDGFLTVLDMDKGDLKTGDWNLTYNALHSTRIRTQKNIDDVVFNVCVSGDKAYVVGTTQGRFVGDINGGAFILKYDIDTLSVLWVKQIAGRGVEAMHCAILDEQLYVGGSVPPGILLDNRKSEASKETHDIFVAKLSATSGDVEFLRQIDSLRDDELIGMAINPSNQHVLLSANARDFATGKTVIFTMDMDQDGNNDWEALAPGIDPFTGLNAETTTPPTVADTPASAGDEDADPEGGDSDDWVIAAAISIPAVILLVVTCYYFCFVSTAQVPLDYPDDPTYGNAAEDTELEVVGGASVI